jgi:hypothetical protein
MKMSVSLMLCWIILTGLVQAGNKDGEYSQSYAILINGDPSGSETVLEKNGSDGTRICTSDHEIFVSDGIQTNRMAFTTKMVFSKSTGRLEFYNYRYTTGDTGDSYDVVIKDDQITRTLNRGGHTSEVSVPFLPNMVILDFNVYHQYDYLIRKYDMKKRGRQLFANFIPVIGSDIPLAITFLDNEKLKNANGTLDVNNFRIECVGIWTGSVSMDSAGRLVRLDIPSQQLQVIRKDLQQ